MPKVPSIETVRCLWRVGLQSQNLSDGRPGPGSFDPSRLIRSGRFDPLCVLLLWCARKDFFPMLWCGRLILVLSGQPLDELDSQLDSLREFIAAMFTPLVGVVLAILFESSSASSALPPPTPSHTSIASTKPTTPPDSATGKTATSEPLPTRIYAERGRSETLPSTVSDLPAERPAGAIRFSAGWASSGLQPSSSQRPPAWQPDRWARTTAAPWPALCPGHLEGNICAVMYGLGDFGL